MELSDMQFLVAEDHSFQRHNLVRVLKDLGAAEVKEAADGKAAYSILTESSGRLDVVICDLDMPGMNGMELMWRMSRSGVPASAILVSRLGHALIASVGDMAKSYGINVLGSIEKPVTREKLLGVIRPHLKVCAEATGGAPRKKLAGASAEKTRTDASAMSATQMGVATGIGDFGEDSPVDGRVLRKMWALDRDMERQLLLDLCASNATDLQTLSISVEHLEREAIARAAHRISGANWSVGALRLADVSTQMERAASHADWPTIDRLSASVHAEAGRLQSYVESM